MQTLRFTVTSFDILRAALTWRTWKMYKLCTNRITSDSTYPLSRVPEEIWGIIEEHLLHSLVNGDHVQNYIKNVYLSGGLFGDCWLFSCDEISMHARHCPEALKMKAELDHIDDLSVREVKWKQDWQKYEDSPQYQDLLHTLHAETAVDPVKARINCDELEKAVQFDRVFYSAGKGTQGAHLDRQLWSIWEMIEQFLVFFGLTRIMKAPSRRRMAFDTAILSIETGDGVGYPWEENTKPQLYFFPPLRYESTRKSSSIPDSAKDVFRSLQRFGIGINQERNRRERSSSASGTSASNDDFASVDTLEWITLEASL